ncbi:MAG TPA: type II secretion system protein GspG [bacterium]|nr:type II secretion system protein GspG [bacterium]
MTWNRFLLANAAVAFFIMLPFVEINGQNAVITMFYPLLVIPVLVIKSFVMFFTRESDKRGDHYCGVFFFVGILLAVELLTMHIPKLMSVSEKTPAGAASGDISAFNSALALYQVDCDSHPFPATTLMQLYSDNAAGWAGPYMATITNDPWGNCYTYTSNGTDYTILTIHISNNTHKSETIRYVFSSGVMESYPL